MRRESSSGTRRWIIWMTITVPIVIVLAVGGYGALSSPGCDSCHTGELLVSATQDSSHAGIECGACHAPSATGDRLLFGFRQVGHMAFPLLGDEGREWAAVPDTRCLDCHAVIETAVVRASGLIVDHRVCIEGSQCTDCHSAVAHGEAVSWVRTYDIETCLECHVSEDLADCATCHVGRLPADRIVTGVFAITHGPEWERTHAMGNSATCVACHTAADCGTCHGPGMPHGPTFMREHAEISLQPEAQCLECHQSRFCDTCHGLEMPHTERFIAEHAAPAYDDEALCRRCHVESDCIVCHEMHVHPGGAIGTLQEVTPDER